MTSHPLCNVPTPILGERRIQIQSGILYLSVTNTTPISYLSNLTISLISTSTPAGFSQIWSGLGPVPEGDSSLTALALPPPLWVTTFLPVSTVTCSVSIGGGITTVTPLLVVLPVTGYGSSGSVVATGKSTAGVVLEIRLTYLYLGSQDRSTWVLTGLSLGL
jgi:hypothetical protein